MKAVVLVVLLALGLIACSGSNAVLEVEIGPVRLDCAEGMIPNKQCLVMDGEPFHESIKRFSCGKATPVP